MLWTVALGQMLLVKDGAPILSKHSVVDNYSPSQFNELMSDNMVHDSCKTYVSIYDINAACKRQNMEKLL